MYSKQKLQQAITRVITFFNFFNHPLTNYEVWKYLGIKCSLLEVIQILNQPFSMSNIQYPISNFHKTSQYNLLNKKLKIAIKAIKKLRYIIGVKMIAVSNNFLYKKASDIDLFIVTAKNRIWTTRFFVTLLMQLFGLRRHGKKIADRICLSFYISEEKLNLQSVTLKYDPLFYYWLAGFIIVYDDNCYDKFFNANLWLKKFLPNITKFQTTYWRTVENNFSSDLIKKINKLWFNSIAGDLIEKIMKFIQLTKMSFNKYSVVNQNDSRVIISDTMLKFHENDPREEYCKRLLNCLSKYS